MGRVGDARLKRVAGCGVNEAPPAWAVTLIAEVRQLAAEVRELRAPAPAAVEADPIARLRAEAEALDIPIVLGGFIAEAGAARLFGRSAACLKAWRQNGRPIARPQKLLGKWHYSIADLAEIQPECLEENEW